MASILTNTFKMYGKNVAFGDNTAIYNGFSSAHYMRDIELIYPVIDDAVGAGTPRYLYTYDASTNKSIINQDTIQYMDSNTPLWQLATVFYMGYNEFVSTIPKKQAIRLFPNRVNFENLSYNTIYITSDDLSVCFSLQMKYSDDRGSINSNVYGFNKSSGTSTLCPLSVIHFNKGTGGSYVSQNYVNNSLVCYDASGEGFTVFSTLGSWPYYTSNSWYIAYHDLNFDSPVFMGQLPELSNNMEEKSQPSIDPYKEGGESETGGGNGDFDRDSGSVPIPDLPTLSAADTGFITLFNPTTAQLKNLAEYMWSGGFDVDTFKKIVADPMECILGLSIVPVNIPSGGSAEVKIGNIGTGVSMTKASSQYVVKDCGSLNLKEYWGSYLDYSPYTKVTSLYLPYVGVVSVDSDIIMNKTLGVKYHIDVLSGQCIAYITVNGNVNFQYQGACSVSIPVTSVDYSSMISAGMNIVSSIAGIGAAGAAGGMMMGGPAGAAIGAATAAISAIPSVANNVMQSKPDIKSGGSVGGMGGMMGVQYPFLIIEWPRQSVPAKQNAFTGYPSNIRARLGSLSGYTECDMVIMDKVSATDAERAEIENLLKGGVYL